MKKIYFICGSQDLYGEKTIEEVRKDVAIMVSFLSEKLKDIVTIEAKDIALTSVGIRRTIDECNCDEDCVGIITWMHTFSPAKMWIKGLRRLKKPLLHLHTQFVEKLPYSSIDMDYMNLNQSAHGDREYSFILTRLGIKHEIAVGYYKSEKVIAKIRRFAEVSIAIDFSENLRCAMFGSNMRDVAVTDGDRVESQIRYGWEVNYYPIGDLVSYLPNITSEEVYVKLDEYEECYEIDTQRIDKVIEQARYEIALEKFIKDNSINAFTDTFQDLYGLNQLPGLAVQNLMKKGIGFGPEGDYKTSCLGAVLNKLAEKREGATGFIEDYTYDFENELELASHMLEVPPQFAANKPKIVVAPLSIGGKDDPARLVFSSKEGEALQITMIDLGTHFKIIAMKVKLVEAKEMPNLPVARLMYKILPSFEEGLNFWLEQGGGHHSILSTNVTIEDLKLFSKLTNTEFVYLDKSDSKGGNK